jgi:hypothetical protein
MLPEKKNQMYFEEDAVSAVILKIYLVFEGWKK